MTTLKNKLLLTTLFLSLFFCLNVPKAHANYTSSFSILTSQPSATNFTNASQALTNDGLTATNSATTYSMQLTIPNATTLALPSDAAIVRFGVKIIGTSSGGTVRVNILDAAGHTCQAVGSTGDSSTISSASITTIYQNTTQAGTVTGGCNGSGYINPTFSNITSYGIQINNGASGTANPIGIDYAQLFVEYTSSSKDYSAAISGTTTLKQTCGGNWLDFQDIFCNFENFLSDLFNFFFGFNPTYASSNFSSIQTAFNSKVPFAYANAALALNFTGIATMSGVPSFTLPIASTPATTTSLYSIPSLPAHSYTTTDSGGAIQGLLTQLRTVISFFLYGTLLVYGVIVWRRFVE